MAAKKNAKKRAKAASTPAAPAKTAKTAKTAKRASPGTPDKVAGKVTPTQSSRNVDIGIATDDRRRIAEGLSRFLADSYTLYLKTHNFHWNVTGPMFNSLHNMFMDQYTEQWTALDEIAERIRALGEFAPQSFGNLTSIRDGNPEAEWEAMVDELKSDNETVCRTAREIFPSAEKAGDQATLDLITQRFQAHEKHAWMLRSTLGGK